MLRARGRGPIRQLPVLSKDATVYLVPTKALAQSSRVRVLPGTIVTAAVLASKSTSAEATPSIADRAARTRAAQPEGQVMPSTWRIYFAAVCAAGAAVSA